MCRVKIVSPDAHTSSDTLLLSNSNSCALYLWSFFQWNFVFVVTQRVKYWKKVLTGWHRSHFNRYIYWYWISIPVLNLTDYISQQIKTHVAEMWLIVFQIQEGRKQCRTHIKKWFHFSKALESVCGYVTKFDSVSHIWTLVGQPAQVKKNIQIPNSICGAVHHWTTWCYTPTQWVAMWLLVHR